MEVKLINVARASFSELRADYLDFLKSHQLEQWSATDARYKEIRDFTSKHNVLDDYEPLFFRWTAEEMANVGLTLCFQIDALMNKYLNYLETTFVTQGGIKERMYQARTGFRQQQDKYLSQLEQNVQQLQKQLVEAQNLANQWKDAYEQLRKKAVDAYNKLKEENERLRGELEGES